MNDEQTNKSNIFLNEWIRGKSKTNDKIKKTKANKQIDDKDITRQSTSWDTTTYGTMHISFDSTHKWLLQRF